MCYLGTKSKQVLGQTQLKMVTNASQSMWVPRLVLKPPIPGSVHTLDFKYTSPYPLHYFTAVTCGWWMLVFTDQHADAFFPAIVCNMFSNSFALFSIWPQRWGIMVLTLYPAHILYIIMAICAWGRAVFLLLLRISIKGQYCCDLGRFLLLYTHFNKRRKKDAQNVSAFFQGTVIPKQKC